VIVDGFLPIYKEFREYCDTLEYGDVTSPIDSVVYPGISLAIPEHIKDEIIESLLDVEDCDITVRAMFLRLTLLGMIYPHQAHTDSSMGDCSLMLYLNRQEHCQGGTSLVTHVETGMYANPRTKGEEDIWRRDTNNPDKWQVTYLAEMQPNRAFMFDARLMHRAEPIGGFGSSAKDGRLVLTCFYDRT
jgi:hypothetical protein